MIGVTSVLTGSEQSKLSIGEAVFVIVQGCPAKVTVVS